MDCVVSAVRCVDGRSQAVAEMAVMLWTVTSQCFHSCHLHVFPFIALNTLKVIFTAIEVSFSVVLMQPCVILEKADFFLFLLPFR